MTAPQSSPGRLQAADVRVYIADVASFAADSGRQSRILGWMTPAELARHARYRHDTDRLMFALGREMARVLVGAELGVDPAAWAWREGPHGRPEIDSPSTNLHFNLSHSAGLVLCALGRGRAVGVDVEDLARRAPDPAIVPRYCSPAEADDVRSRGDRWRDRFLIYWTLKEAYLKARGLGISVPLADISFHVDDAGIRIRFERSLAGTDDRWAFHLWQPTPRHLAAIAAEAPGGAPPAFSLHGF